MLPYLFLKFLLKKYYGYIIFFFRHMTSPIWIPMPLHGSWGKKIKSLNKELGHNLYLTFKYNHTKSKINKKIKKSLIALVKHVMRLVLLYTILPYCSNKSCIYVHMRWQFCPALLDPPHPTSPHTSFSRPVKVMR